MSQSETDKIRERLQELHLNPNEANLYPTSVALEAVVDECESSRYPVDRQSSLIDSLFNLIADELNVEEE